MELRDYLRVVATRKWIIIQAVAVVAAVALVGSILQAPTYEAESEVYIRERSSGPNIFGDLLQEWNFQPERRLQTQVELIKLRPLAETVVKRLNLRMAPSALLGKLQVEPVGQTNIIKVRVTDTDPRQAMQIANAFGEAYVTWSRESNQSALKKARELIATKLEEARQELFAVAKEITRRESARLRVEAANANPSRDTKAAAPPVPEELKAQLQVGTGLFVTLSEKLEQLTINEALEQGLGQVVSPAVLPRSPVRPRPMLNLFLGLIVGGVLGLGGALLAEYMDNTIKTGDDAERYYGATTIARVPAHGSKEKRTHEVAVLGGPHTPEAEAYRALRTALDYLNFDGSIKKILVTSAAPREGKSTTLVNLAASMANAGKRVLIIGCDFRRPALHRFFGLKNKAGLSDVLTGRVSLRAAIQDSGVPNLGILLSGPLPPNPSELLGSQTMRSLLDHATSVADFILIDSPPVLAVTDCAVLAPLVDGILMVCEAGASTREAAQAAVSVLAASETRILGVVLNNALATERHGYYYYYDYYRATDAAYEAGDLEGAGGDEFLGAEGAVSAEEQAQAAPRERGRLSRGPHQPQGWRAAGTWFFRALGIAAVIAVVAALLVLLDVLLGLGLVRALTQSVLAPGSIGLASLAAGVTG